MPKSLPLSILVGKHLSDLKVSFSEEDRFFSGTSAGYGTFFSTFRVFPDVPIYDVDTLNKWFKGILPEKDFVFEELNPQQLYSASKGWTYFPQASSSSLLYLEKLISLRRKDFVVKGIEPQLLSVASHIKAVLEAQRGRVVEPESRSVDHIVKVIGYPEKAIVDAYLAGKLCARNFISPAERERYGSKQEGPKF